MISDYFSQAKPISHLKNILENELPNANINGSNTLWATSICSDEVNQSIHVLDDYFDTDGPFVMGGISGIPFAGKTGFKAFVSHIPDKGGAVIIFGPHIGFTKKGEAGKVTRKGQESPSSCCGSLVAGLSNIKAGNIVGISHDDYQQGQVNKTLTEHYEELQQAQSDIVAATNITYDQIKKELLDIIGESLDSLESKPLLLLGGVIINTDTGEEDQFDLRDVIWFNH